MESTLAWQMLIIASVALSCLHSKLLMIFVALGWTAWTIMAVNTSPLLALQLVSAWGTVWIISWLTGLFQKTAQKTNNSTLKIGDTSQPDRLESVKKSGNPQNKIGVSFSNRLVQLSDAVDRFNENIKKEAEKDKINQDFLLKHHSFRTNLDHVMTMAEMAYESEHLFANDPEKREVYEDYLKKLSETAGHDRSNSNKIKLKPAPAIFDYDEPSLPSFALRQRVEKTKECLIFIDEIENRLSKNTSLLEYIEKVKDGRPFKLFLGLQKAGLHFSLARAERQQKYTPASSLHVDSQHEDATEYPDDIPLDFEERRKVIENFVAKRGVKYLVHFSQVENIPTILKYGLIGRSALELINSDALVNDGLRLDNVHDAISTSISFPNYKMFYRLQRQNPKADWVVIKISPSILWELDCAFCCSNAAGRASRGVPLEDRRSPEAFKKMFDENVSDVVRKKLNIPDNYTTDPQAEVLVLEAVDPKYILSISLNEKVKINNFPKVTSVISPYLKTVNFVHEPLMFSPRRDYQHWAVQDEVLKSNQENPYLRDFKF